MEESRLILDLLRLVRKTRAGKFYSYRDVLVLKKLGLQNVFRARSNTKLRFQIFPVNGNFQIFNLQNFEILITN